MGRPREHDRVKVAKDLIEWSKKPDNINLCGFCADYDLDPNLILTWANGDENFSRAYRIAKANLGIKREKMLNKGKLHQLAYAKNSKVYDPFLKSEEREDATFESNLKKEEEGNSTKTLNVNITSYSDNKPAA